MKDPVSQVPFQGRNRKISALTSYSTPSRVSCYVFHWESNQVNENSFMGIRMANFWEEKKNCEGAEDVGAWLKW
jgi:hypothetical protein